MQVHVNIIGELRRFVPGSEALLTLEVAPRTRLGNLVGQLGLPVGLPRTVLVNGKRVGDDSPLAPGAEVVIFAPVEGG